MHKMGLQRMTNLEAEHGGLQVYGFGLSEQFLGEFMRETNTRPIIATKYAPLPWRFTSGTVMDACR